jgi:hypothetical protein
MIVRFHQPLWGGFPMRWVKGPANAATWTEDEDEAGDYAKADVEVKEARLDHEYPNAVVVTY